MLKPNKHLNLDTSVLYVSSLLLKWLSNKRLMTYADLYGVWQRFGTKWAIWL
jgi:hypothetical protein